MVEEERGSRSVGERSGICFWLGEGGGWAGLLGGLGRSWEAKDPEDWILCRERERVLDCRWSVICGSLSYGALPRMQTRGSGTRW